MALSADVARLAGQWLEWDMNPATKAQVQGWIDAGNESELRAAMVERIAFGTAGLRAEMKAGFAYMNLLIVTQATQGLLVHLEHSFPDLKQRGVVVGYDGRHNSLAFARRTAAIFASRGVPVALFSEVVPTPFVSFGVRHLGTRAGIMVTASHNPAADNGYKVYWDNASQIVSPHDKDISAAIVANQVPWPIDVAHLLASPLVSDPTANVSAAFYSRIQEWNFHVHANRASKLKIVFTPMHGVGGKWASKAFAAFSLPDFFPVMAQLFPDPDFPTVAFPNPEEGKGALKLAFECADRVGSSVVIANDPDSDRLAAAEKHNGVWRPFSGNEIGTLLAHWTLTQYRKKHLEADPKTLLFVNTTVSSKMMSAIAKKEGIRYEETLTGFKWIGDLVLRLEEKEGCKLMLAFEQAIGYMVGSMCPDKDGIRTAAVFAEMAVHLYEHQHTTLSDHLEHLYVHYGYMAARDSYFFCHDPRRMFGIFEELKSADGSYPTHMGKYEITRVRDLMRPGHDSAFADKKPILPVSSSPMITFFFANGAVFTLRGSGTEPKLKYYSELPGPRGESDATLADMIHEMTTHFLKPQANGLLPPASE